MSQDNQAPFIEITNLVKKFGTFTALNGVSLNVLPGERFTHYWVIMVQENQL